MGNDGYLERAAVDRRHSQTDAVDGDRAFFDDVAEQLGPGRNGDPDGIIVLAVFLDRSGAIDVAADDVPAQAGIKLQCPFQIDAAAHLQAAKV
ncbi:hypothetical protein SDC9_200491 [bioreactor metagenome]|uniref:Uncharacterized protein n=1 Tax=bioreactor metagenome TaxID=1076179 RepID=A0A645INC8_9ZZZZ